MQRANSHINKSGHLDVGDGHSIYWEDWGNPQAEATLHLHGGPGSGFSDKHKLLYYPAKHRVIFHDQRGSGKSLPSASTERNTTQDLIADIEKLRMHFGIERAAVVGGSWGSALALLYSLAHPQRVKRLIIWGVFLCRQIEVDYVNQGDQLRFIFPEAWERFVALVPEQQRTSGDEIMRFYAEKLNSANQEEAQRYADEWNLWQSTLVSINYDLRRLEHEVIGDENNLAVARLETHYFLNKCFIPEGYILDNIHRIKDIPCSVVQGRFDFCTPPIGALALAKAYGSNLTLQWTNAGHLRTEPENLVALRAIINTI